MLNLQDYQILKKAVEALTIKGSDATYIAMLLGKLEKEVAKHEKKMASKAA